MPLVPGPRLPAPARRAVRRSALALALVLCLATVAVLAGRGADRAGHPPTSQLLSSSAGVTSHTLTAVADATTRADAPTATSGTGPTLRVDGTPVVRSFIRFDVPDAGPIQRATLQLHAETANRVGFDVRGATGNWSERTLTYATAPKVGPVVGASGRLAAGQDASVDVTALARPGARLDLAVTTSSPTNTRFTSREGGAGGPRLILATVDPTADDDPAAGEDPAAPGGTGDWQPTRPIRAAFYYPWFPEAWRQQGKDPFSVYQPSAGYYDSGSAAVIAGHIDAMRYAGIQAGISSWWGQGTATDQRFPLLLKAAAGTPFRWSVYYEPEGQRDPTVAELTADLTYLRDHYGGDPSYLRIDGRFVVFVYGGAESCDLVDRWRQANTVGAYLVLKVFSGYQDCAAQPDAWHQYGPAVAASSHLPWSVTVSPGFHKATEAAPRLDRDLDRWRRDVEAMAASPAQFHLVTTFNEWGEGTAVESSTAWPSGTGYGRYLDVLHEVQPPAPVRTAAVTEPLRTPTDPVIAAAGDMACDPASASFNGGAGGRTACHQLAVSNLVAGRDLAAFLPLGDAQYEDGALEKFQAAYGPSFGRAKAVSRPVVGNHEYLTPGAAGYFGYFGSAAGEPGKGWYSYDLGEWHLIALNSMCGQAGGCGPDSPQGRWLKADLAAHPNACTLAYWHHPRFSSGKHGSSTAVAPLWQALYQAGAELVLNGHDHVYERFAPQDPGGAADPARGIREFVVGTGGANHYPFTTPAGITNSQVRNADTFGVLELTLGHGGYQWRFLPAAGGTFTDSGSGICH